MRTRYLLMPFLVIAAGLGGCAQDNAGYAPGSAPGPASKAKISCKAKQGATEIAAARLFIEHNATDKDTGIQGGFDDDGYSELCVYDPDGKQILGVRPLGKLKELTMADTFFESREPPNSELSINELLEIFPEGDYEVRALSFDGKGLKGSATLTHDIPAAPEITSPALTEEEKVSNAAGIDRSNIKIEWREVTKTLQGGPVNVTAYQITVTKQAAEDPHGFSVPTYDVHIAAGHNSLSVPAEFLERDTVYELEVLALEKSGNQTISAGFFKTE